MKIKIFFEVFSGFKCYESTKVFQVEKCVPEEILARFQNYIGMLEGKGHAIFKAVEISDTFKIDCDEVDALEAKTTNLLHLKDIKFDN